LIAVGFDAGAGDFSLRHRVQTGSEAHPASYTMSTGGSFPGDEAAGAAPCSAEVKECMELYLHYPNKFSWRGAYRDNFTFNFTQY
jgi:hypothetical protein